MRLLVAHKVENGQTNNHEDDGRPERRVDGHSRGGSDGGGETPFLRLGYVQVVRQDRRDSVYRYRFAFADSQHLREQLLHLLQLAERFRAGVGRQLVLHHLLVEQELFGVVVGTSDASVDHRLPLAGLDQLGRELLDGIRQVRLDRHVIVRV